MACQAQEVGAGCFQRGLAFSEPFWREVYFCEKQQFKMQGEQVVQYDIKRDHKRLDYAKHP
jgi:hypothetical protein